MLPTKNYSILMCMALVSWMSIPVSPADGSPDCVDLKAKDQPLAVYQECANDKFLFAASEYKLDIGQLTQQQLDAWLAKVEEIRNVVIMSKDSQHKTIEFPALTKAENVHLELWNNHHLTYVRFSALDRTGSTFGKINIRGNENLRQEAIDHLAGLPKAVGANNGQIQEVGECFHGLTGLSRSESSMTTVDSGNWNSFRNCRFHSGDIQFSSTLLDYHGELFGNTFKNISGCVLIKDTYLSNINFLGHFSRYCDEWRNKERGVFNNSRLCLSKEQDRKLGSIQARNRDSSCRHRCNQASNGTLVPEKKSITPCHVIEGSLVVQANSVLENYDEVRHVYGNVSFTGTTLKSIELPKLQGVGFGCHTSIEIIGNTDLEEIDLGSFVSSGWLGPKDECLEKPRIVIKGNRYRIPDSERPKWLSSFPKVDLDIDFKMPPGEPTSFLWYITVVVVPLLLVVAAKLMYDYYDNVRTLDCRPRVPWIKDLEKGSASTRSKEQLLHWVKMIIPETYLGWRNMGYLDLNVHNGSHEVLHRLNDEEKAKTLKKHDQLKKRHAKLLKKIPPISLLPNPLNAPSATASEFNERFDMYKGLATQKEDTICLMYDDKFVKDAGRLPLTRLPFRIKDELNPLPRVNQRSVKGPDGNTVLDPKLRIPIKEKISFQYMGVQPTTDITKCRKVEMYVETELWDSEKERLVITHRRMFLMLWATYSYNSPPTSPHEIATLLTLRESMWNHSMRLWVFSGMAHEFHLNVQMLIWTILTAKDSLCPTKLGLWSVVDLANAISTGFDGGFNLNMLCYTLHSMVSLAFKNNLIPRNDPIYFETGDWLALADRADPVMRFLRTGSLYLEDVAPPPEMYNRIVNHPRFNMILTFSVHTKMRGGVPVHRWPSNFWISFGRFPKTLLPVHKFPRVEFLDFNRDYSVPWMPIRKRLRESRRLTLAEMDLLHTLNRRPAIKIGQLTLEPLPQEDAMLVVHDAMKQNKKKDAAKKKVVVGKVTKGKMVKGEKKMKKEADKGKLKKMSKEFVNKVKKVTKLSKSAKRKEKAKPKAINVDVELGLTASNLPTKLPGHGFAVMVVDETQRE